MLSFAKKYHFIYTSYPKSISKSILKDTQGRKRGEKDEKETYYITSSAFVILCAYFKKILSY